mgnify:CR=1 FL=1
MKIKLRWLGVAGLLALAGCGHYQITLTNGHVLSARGKPRLDREFNIYRFKDAEGKEAMVPAFKVREIAPR